MAACVAHPGDHCVGLARPHRAAHHVLHAAVRAGEGAPAGSVERGHSVVEKSREVTIVEHRQQRLGDQRNYDIFLAGLRADSLRHRVALAQLAAQEVLDNIAPDILCLADDGGDAAFVEELARVGETADVEAAHHRRDALGDELKREVPSARILIRLHAGQPDQQLDAIFACLFLDRRDCLGADDAVADFVPNHGFEADVALDRIALVERLVERRHHRQGVVGLDAVAEILDEAVFVVARRFDEIDPNSAARLGLDCRVGGRAFAGRQLKLRRGTITAIAISAQQPIENTGREYQE